MAVDVLEYPFRFDAANSSFAHITEGADNEKSQQIRSFVLTKKGERPMLPSFGIEDPVFSTFNTGEFIVTWADFYSPEDITITNVSLSEFPEGTTDIIVEFE